MPIHREKLINEEISWGLWPADERESKWTEEEGWEILTETNQNNEARHWFKQNFTKSKAQTLRYLTLH